MSATQINILLDLWAAAVLEYGDSPPFSSTRHMYKTIDDTPLGDVKWQKFGIWYTGHVPEVNPPPWMLQTFEVWFCDPHSVVHQILGNPNFTDEMDLQPFREFSSDEDEHQWKDFMSGDWAWEQADKISEDTDTHGSVFVPVILGSDKMTVSVATGNNEYNPLYASFGNIRNHIRQAHNDALVLIGFLSIPKTTKEHASDTAFQKFCQKLFHLSLAMILGSLKPAMTKPEVVQFGNGYFHWVVYSLGPYIVDYEEQVLLACIVRGWCARCQANQCNLDADALQWSQEFSEALFKESTLLVLWDKYGIVGDLMPFMNDFPRVDIHQLIAPNLLHQIIKGVFKDHLVDWVADYLKAMHGAKDAGCIMDDIDRRIAAVASFTSLWWFLQRRGFKQWTGDNSKALMKIYITAIEGHVPPEIVHTFHAFLEFCYLVWHNIISEKALAKVEDAIQQFHHYHKIFKTIEIVSTFSLPRQHLIKHYPSLICLFGAPNVNPPQITQTQEEMQKMNNQHH
ncbi:hypothetical protein PAXRUDRAFT_14614 [Paxillus rubicundulus Ve08.2h10]|uniref:Uncharacterized protein n=1 Tax=Paxillus rubicundulus Ve08.2h10 TaxID=930991 RepID=A0A0D0D4Z7_9AGAM|nr:hypothetical protein PAXRUDRAFT_14614 [Paxillus rubicundulus Ve08.2h10]